jgi:carboxylate-amine ligase
MPFSFNGSPTHSLGVEVELQLVDAQTLALSNRAAELLSRVPGAWADKFKPEFMQCYCEINTDVCQTVGQVERDLTEKLDWAQQAAAEMGLRLVWAGTHPFSKWDEQQITPGERYAWLLDTMQEAARRLLIFGLHVHVGVDSGDKAIHMIDRLLRHLPTLLALSANSPMWYGRDTGMASYRSKTIEALPISGLPPAMRNWSEYVWLVDRLIDAGFIKSVREVWWDVRPHGGFGTLELRIMDMPLNLRHLLGLVALSQSLIASLSHEIEHGVYLTECHPMIAAQNKWHAGRYGMQASFVDPDTMTAISATASARRLIASCRPFAERLGCAEHLANLDDILTAGTGAQRQREASRRGGDMRQVARFLTDQHHAQPVS